jgi:plastocyanin
VHSRARSRLFAALALASSVALASCGSSGPDPQAPFAGATLTIQARDLTFAPDIATAPAGTPLRVILDNKDVGVPHNLRVFQGETEIGKTSSVEGPGLIAVELPALAPGRYQFECTIHPSMIGTIIVAPGASAGPSDPAETPPPDGPSDLPGDSIDPSAGS